MRRVASAETARDLGWRDGLRGWPVPRRRLAAHWLPSYRSGLRAALGLCKALQPAPLAAAPTLRATR